jgi:hypothetical protein
VPDEPILREKARAAVKRGKLPGRRPDRIWGGSSVVALCAICELLVNEMDFEMEFEYSGGPAKFHVHSRCFAAWEFERGNV